jgi:hypothetical protein
MHITGEPEGTPVKVGVAITGTNNNVFFFFLQVQH